MSKSKRAPRYWKPWTSQDAQETVSVSLAIQLSGTEASYNQYLSTQVAIWYLLQRATEARHQQKIELANELSSNAVRLFHHRVQSMPATKITLTTHQEAELIAALARERTIEWKEKPHPNYPPSYNHIGGYDWHHHFHTNLRLGCQEAESDSSATGNIRSALAHRILNNRPLEVTTSERSHQLYSSWMVSTTGITTHLLMPLSEVFSLENYTKRTEQRAQVASMIMRSRYRVSRNLPTIMRLASNAARSSHDDTPGAELANSPVFLAGYINKKLDRAVTNVNNTPGAILVSTGIIPTPDLSQISYQNGWKLADGTQASSWADAADELCARELHKQITSGFELPPNNQLPGWTSPESDPEARAIIQELISKGRQIEEQERSQTTGRRRVTEPENPFNILGSLMESASKSGRGQNTRSLKLLELIRE